MKLISLTGKYGVNKFAKISEEDYEKINKYKWHVKKDKWGNLTAATEIKGKCFRMHRMVLNICDPKIFADHINHDGLDNQRFNLRESTPMQNSQNRSSRKNSSSRFLGVSKVTYNKYAKGRVPQTRYSSAIRVNKKLIWLGHFPNTPCGELLAAIKYDVAAEQLHGEFANLNFKKL